MKYLILAIFLIGCSPPVPQSKCGFIMDANSQRTTWEYLPVSISVNSNVPPSYFEGINKAISVWNSAIGKTFFKLVPHDKIFQVEILNLVSWSGLSYTQANTNLMSLNSSIRRSEVKINSQYFEYYSGPEGDSVNMDSLMVHELGHVLGLDHMSGTVMDPYLPYRTYRVELTQYELDALRCGYP